MGSKFVAVLTLILITTVTIAAEHTVEIKNMIGSTFMMFEPGLIKVAVGDTVRFIPSDVGHNSQSVEGLIPEGAKVWKGDINQKISVTVDKEGVYVYQCSPPLHDGHGRRYSCGRTHQLRNDQSQHR